MTNEKTNLNLKLIEEKINNKFLELKYHFESKNEEISSKLKEINNILENLIPKEKGPIPHSENFLKLEKDLKTACEKYDSLLTATNLKLEEIQKEKKGQTFDLNFYKEKLASSLNSNNGESKNDNEDLLDIISKLLMQNGIENNNKINSLEKNIEEIKKENNNLKEMIKNSDKEFNTIKIRFSELLDFIRDKNFWKKFITKILEKDDLNVKKNNNDINDIFTPFNYYEYFGVEGNKNFMDEASNTTQNKGFNKTGNKNLDIEVKNISINEQMQEYDKFKTPNNVPNINIIKSFQELNSNFIQNLKQKNNNNILFNNTGYKKIPKQALNKYKEQNSLNGDDKINNKKKTKVNEYILQANFLNGLVKDKDNINKSESENLSEAYILQQTKKIKKFNFEKKEQKYYQTLPLSMKYNIKFSRNNSLNRFNMVSYKDLRKGNLEDLYYSKLKKDKIGNISGIYFRSNGLGDINVNTNNININNTNIINNQKRFPIIKRGKSK